MHPLESVLATVEQQLERVAAALVAADPQALEACSTQLRDVSAQFAQCIEQMSGGGALPASLQKRVQAIGAALSAQREGLARLAAVTERQAAGLLPPSDAGGTYGSSMGGRNAGSVARIYRSAS